MDQVVLNIIESRFKNEVNSLVNLFNSKVIDESISWIAFKKGYDETLQNYEVTLDSGEGTQVKFIFDDVKVEGSSVRFKVVVDGIIANNAEMNITNLRRHGFDDYKYGPIKKHMIDPYKIYQNFRFHDKVFSGSEAYFYYLNADVLTHIGKAFEAVMRVGQKRQDKTGIAAHEKVAQLDFKRDIQDSIAAIQLVDTGAQEVNEIIKDVRDWFYKIDTTYNTNEAKLYKNPYTGKSSVRMKVNISFYTDNTKFKTEKDPKTDPRFHLFVVNYIATFDTETNECTVSENQWNYEKPYYFDTPIMQLPISLKNSADLRAKLGQNIPYPERKSTYEKSTVLKYLSMIINDMRNAQHIHDTLLASLTEK